MHNSVEIQVDFAWLVPISLSWSDLSDGKWSDRRFEATTRYLSDGQPAQPFPAGREYRPLQEQTGLFRQFADVNPSEKGVLSFATSFGLLGKGHNILTADGLTIHGEPLELWRTEILQMRQFVQLWDAASKNDLDTIRKLLPQSDLEKLPLAVIRAWSLDSDDAAQRAIAAVRGVVDTKLVNVSLQLRYVGATPKLQLQPRDLITAMWLQFGAAIHGLKVFRTCEVCSRPFEVSKSRTSGKRADARFCGQACRMNKYRTRISDARRLHEQGVAVREIARRFEAPIKRVRGWINGK